MAGLSRRLAAAAVVIGSGAALAACGGGANADAVIACKGVHRAVVAYDASRTARSSAQRAADLREATHDVAAVQQDAAMANSADGSYDAFMTLLQQAQEIPLRDVLPALTAVCKTIDSPTNYL